MAQHVAAPRMRERDPDEELPHEQRPDQVVEHAQGRVPAGAEPDGEHFGRVHAEEQHGQDGQRPLGGALPVRQPRLCWGPSAHA